MPRLSDTMSEGTVGKWLKKQGEPVAKGDILAEIETDKATMELESFQAGTMGQILIPEGQTVEIGVPIALILAPGEQPGAPPPNRAPTVREGAHSPAAPAPVSQPPSQTAPAPVYDPAPVAAQSEGRLRVSPLARRIAGEQGVDLSRVTGTGPGSRITREDVEQFARLAQAPSPVTVAFPGLADEEIALSSMQQTIVRRMLDSKQQAPDFYVTVEIDMTEAVSIRRTLNAALQNEPGITFNDLVVRAVALALRAHPQLNMSYKDGKFIKHNSVHVGIAVAIADGLVVPAVRDADRKTLREIGREARDLIDRARNRKLTLQELEGSTFSVTNLGMYDVDQFTGIINQPNAAILAVGAIQKKPAVKNDQIVIADRMRVTLSADHRVVYGAHAAEFLRELKRLLENPLLLMA